MPIRSDNTAVDRYFSGPLREHFPPLIMPIIIWIETRQPSARFVLYESLTTKVVVNRHYRLMKTCNARFKRRDQYLSGNRETNDKQYTLNIRSRGKQLVLFSRESWCFPIRSPGNHQDSRGNKTNWFPEGPDIKCFVIFLDFHFNSNKRITGAYQNSRPGTYNNTNLILKTTEWMIYKVLSLYYLHLFLSLAANESIIFMLSNAKMLK